MSQKKRNCKIGILGAGFSGLCAAIQLQLQLGIDDYVIFEENEDVGGVWLANTYPGCASDVPTHFYSFSFAPKPDWSKLFCLQPEILEYLRWVARKYDLYKNIRFRHRVTKVSWDETISKWRVLVSNSGESSIENVEYIFEELIICMGAFRVPHVPVEFEDFLGPKIHSARWNNSVELHDKNVAVVGTGASAVQIIPEIVDSVKTLTVYQRRPPWVVPRFQVSFPNWMQWAFENIPGIRQTFRSSLFWLYEFSHSIYKKDSTLGRLAERFGKHFIKQGVIKEDKELTIKLTPKYHIGCKRITPSDDYYPALNRANVKIITDPITKVKSSSIITRNGDEEHIDILILATGFAVQEYFSPMNIIAKGSVDLLKAWKEDGPSTYLGMCSSLLPNAFFVMGPNSAPGSTSAVFTVECQVNWIIQVLKEKRRRGSSLVTVKESAEKEYMARVLSELEYTVWSEDCGSYFRDHRGIVTALIAKSGLSLWWHTRTSNFEDLIFN